MADAGWAVQKALFAVLDAGLTVPVYDSVPASPAFPYLTVGEDTTVDVSGKMDSNQEFDAAIHIWSRERGRWQVKQIIDQVDELLHGESLPIDAPYTVVDMQRTGSQSFMDQDGLTMHGVATFRLYVSGP